MALEFTDSNFQAEVLDKQGVAVIDFWAEWCGPCKAIGPIIDELHTEMGEKAIIGKVDVDQNQETSLKYGVRSIPTIVILKNGEIVDKHVGVTTKQVLMDSINKAMN